jgi:hypothetical protein
MAAQNGDLVRFFNERGYQPVLFARSDLTPPDMYNFTDGNYERLGPLASFLKSEVPISPPTHAYAPDFERVETNKHTAEVSFSFLKNLLERFGLGSTEGKANIAADVDSTYRFNDVTIASVNVIDIEGALKAGFLTDHVKSEAANGSIHVAYEYIYAGTVKISRGDHDDISVGLSANLPQVAKVSTSASQLGKDSSSVSYQNSTRPVVIAFKVGQLVPSRAEWKLRVGSRAGAGFDPLSANKTPYVYRKGEILTIRQHGDQVAEEPQSQR